MNNRTKTFPPAYQQGMSMSLGGPAGEMKLKQKIVLLTTEERQDSIVTAFPSEKTHLCLGGGCYHAKRQPGC